MANDIKVNIPAKNATKDARRVMNFLVENKAKRNAKNVAMVAARKKKKIHQIKGNIDMILE